MKKIITATLILNLMIMQSMPLAAVAAAKTPVIKSQISEYKIDNVNLDWWKNYQDEYLEGYIVKAINENQDLKIATLKIEEARQNVKLQFANELPTLSLGAGQGVYKMPGVKSTEGTFGLPIIASYEADIFLKNHDKTKSSKKLHEISKFNEKAAYIAVASQVGATYFNIVQSDKLISIQNEIIKDRKQIYELMKIRNREGITSTADLTRAEKAYVMATADLKDLEKARVTLLNSLAVLIGESPNNAQELKRVSYEMMISQIKVPDSIPSDIITHRPDYLAAEKYVEKAGLDVRIAKKEFLPQINILGMLAFATGSSMGAMNWTNAFSLFGAQAMLPIFTGGSKFANLRLHKNKYEQILQSYYKTNITAIQEVNDSLSTLKLDNEKYHKNLESYKMQKDDYNYMKKRYEQGVISKLDLIQQRETLLVMDKLVVSSKTNCFINQISLYKAVGAAKI